MSNFDLHNVFDDLDGNKDGFLTLEEICEWMRKSNVKLNKEKLSKLVGNCDWNGDGCLDFDEFVVFNSHLEEHGLRETTPDLNDDADPEGEMHEAFSVFDKDGDGFISPLELRTTLSELGLISAPVNMEGIKNMINKVDTDGDGQVNFSEFQTMMENDKCTRE